MAIAAQSEPHLGDFATGEDSTIGLAYLNSRDQEPVDITGATISVTFTPTSGVAFVKSGTLRADPTAAPQADVELEDTDTENLAAPQRVKGVALATLPSGRKRKIRFVFQLAPG